MPVECISNVLFTNVPNISVRIPLLEVFRGRKKLHEKIFQQN